LSLTPLPTLPHRGGGGACGSAIDNIVGLPPHPSRHATCAELRSRKIAAESPLPDGERRIGFRLLAFWLLQFKPRRSRPAAADRLGLDAGRSW
jgi:hypothetical protein